MGVTIKDVASDVGVSNVAAWYALNGGGRISPSTRERVKRAATRLGYRPNSSAKSMRTGKFGTIGLLLSHFANRSYLPHQLLTGIEGELASRGLRLMVGRLPDEKLIDRSALPTLLTQWSVDGLLINYQEQIPDKMVDLLRIEEVPAVWINSKQEQCCAYMDDFGAGRDATTRLLGLGHRSIAYVDYSHAAAAFPEGVHYSAVDRQAGYEAAMNSAGLATRIIRGDDVVSNEQRPAFSRSWLSEASAPTAIVCYSITAALPVTVAAMLMGKLIPRDLSIIIVNDQPLAPLGFYFSTMVNPLQKLGTSATQLLCERLEGVQIGPVSFCVPYEFHPGDSIAPPRTGR